MRYLSPEWMDAAAVALAADSRLVDTTKGTHLVLDQVVTDGPADLDDEIRWHVAIADGDVRFVPGSADRYDLRISTSYDTAAQIASGRLGAQRAFVEGRLRLGGNLNALVDHQRVIGSMDDALGEVRAATDFGFEPE